MPIERQVNTGTGLTGGGQLNGNLTLTTNVGNLLIRSGMHPLYVTSFMAQPILREYVAYQNSQKSLVQDDTTHTQNSLINK